MLYSSCWYFKCTLLCFYWSTTALLLWEYFYTAAFSKVRNVSSCCSVNSWSTYRVKNRCDVRRASAITLGNINGVRSDFTHDPPLHLCMLGPGPHTAHSARHVRSNYSWRLHARGSNPAGTNPPRCPRASCWVESRQMLDLTAGLQTCLWSAVASASSWTASGPPQQSSWWTGGYLLNNRTMSLTRGSLYIYCTVNLSSTTEICGTGTSVFGLWDTFTTVTTNTEMLVPNQCWRRISFDLMKDQEVYFNTFCGLKCAVVAYFIHSAS